MGNDAWVIRTGSRPRPSLLMHYGVISERIRLCANNPIKAVHHARRGVSGVRQGGGRAYSSLQAQRIRQELGGITELGDVKFQQPASAEESESQLMLDWCSK